MGFLKFSHDRSEEVLTGVYYKHYPLYPTEQAIKFNYAIVDDRNRTYSTILDGLHGTMKMQTIKTDDDIKFIDVEDEKLGFVATQDGEFWEIQGVLSVPSTENNKQALRRRVKTIQTRSIIRLIGVDKGDPDNQYVGEDDDEDDNEGTI